jgi:2-dehydropantoate 2-reductase
MAESILIVGSGAMASLFGARLASSGVRVTMLGGWQAGVRALRGFGVRLLGDNGSEKAYPVRVVEDPLDCKGHQNALVLVKSWQTERAARQLGTCLDPHGLALTLQNGLGNLEILEKALGKERAALGVTTTGATLVEPGRVRPVGDGSVSLGMHPGIEPVAEMLEQAGFKIEILENTDSLMWGKLVINAAINPLTALLKFQNGELLNHPASRALLGDTAREAASVAESRGVRLPYSDPVSATEKVAELTATNTSSMLSDILRGTPTEIDAISGAIVRTGQATHVPTPVNQTLWRLVKAATDKSSNGHRNNLL